MIIWITILYRCPLYSRNTVVVVIIVHQQVAMVDKLEECRSSCYSNGKDSINAQLKCCNIKNVYFGSCTHTVKESRSMPRTSDVDTSSGDEESDEGKLETSVTEDIREDIKQVSEKWSDINRDSNHSEYGTSDTICCKKCHLEIICPKCKNEPGTAFSASNTNALPVQDRSVTESQFKMVNSVLLTKPNASLTRATQGQNSRTDNGKTYYTQTTQLQSSKTNNLKKSKTQATQGQNGVIDNGNTYYTQGTQGQANWSDKLDTANTHATQGQANRSDELDTANTQATQGQANRSDKLDTANTQAIQGQANRSDKLHTANTQAAQGQANRSDNPDTGNTQATHGQTNRTDNIDAGYMRPTQGQTSRSDNFGTENTQSAQGQTGRNTNYLNSGNMQDPQGQTNKNVTEQMHTSQNVINSTSSRSAATNGVHTRSTRLVGKTSVDVQSQTQILDVVDSVSVDVEEAVPVSSEHYEKLPNYILTELRGHSGFLKEITGACMHSHKQLVRVLRGSPNGTYAIWKIDDKFIGLTVRYDRTLKFYVIGCCFTTPNTLRCCLCCKPDNSYFGQLKDLLSYYQDHDIPGFSSTSPVSRVRLLHPVNTNVGIWRTKGRILAELLKCP